MQCSKHNHKNFEFGSQCKEIKIGVACDLFDAFSTTFNCFRDEL